MQPRPSETRLETFSEDRSWLPFSHGGDGSCVRYLSLGKRLNDRNAISLLGTRISKCAPSPEPLTTLQYYSMYRYSTRTLIDSEELKENERRSSQSRSPTSYCTVVRQASKQALFLKVLHRSSAQRISAFPLATTTSESSNLIN